MDKTIPFLTLDSDLNVTAVFNGIDTLYPFLTMEGFFSHLFGQSKADDVTLPAFFTTAGLAEENLKLFVTREKDNLNCYVLENNDRIIQHNMVNYRMREPVTSIFALLPVIVDSINTDKPERAISNLEEIYSSSYKLIRTITNLSLTDKLETGMLNRKSAVNLSSLVQSICDSVSAVLKYVTVKCDVENDIIVNGSKKLFVNGILNLISNSMEYCSDEKVCITVSLSVNGKNAVFSYSDNSKGIKDEYLQYVFNPFYAKDPYGDGSLNFELGLGLHIAKSAFEHAGGNILLTSEFGKGVKYTASVPLYFGDDMVLESSVSDFLLNKYSEVFIQLCDSCTLPSIR